MSEESLIIQNKMSEEPTRSQKRSRCDPAAAPPYGYHFEGQPAQMIDGMLTLRLRRNVEGSHYSKQDVGRTNSVAKEVKM